MLPLLPASFVPRIIPPGQARQHIQPHFYFFHFSKVPPAPLYKTHNRNVLCPSSQLLNRLCSVCNILLHWPAYTTASPLAIPDLLVPPIPDTHSSHKPRLSLCCLFRPHDSQETNLFSLDSVLYSLTVFPLQNSLDTLSLPEFHCQPAQPRFQSHPASEGARRAKVFRFSCGHTSYLLRESRLL